MTLTSVHQLLHLFLANVLCVLTGVKFNIQPARGVIAISKK